MKNKRTTIVLAAGVLAVGLFLALFVLPRVMFMLGRSEPPGGLAAITPRGEALPADPALALPENAAAQQIRDLQVTLALTPYPPVGFQPAAFDITLKDANGAVTDAAVTLDLTMPAMRMPLNQPAAQHAGGGLYHAPGRFTMRGLWYIEVILQRGGEKQSVFFSVWL